MSGAQHHSGDQRHESTLPNHGGAGLTKQQYFDLKLLIECCEAAWGGSWCVDLNQGGKDVARRRRSDVDPTVKEAEVIDDAQLQFAKFWKTHKSMWIGRMLPMSRISTRLHPERISSRSPEEVTRLSFMVVRNRERGPDPE